MPETTCPLCNAMVAFASGHALRETICPQCKAVIAISDVPTGKQDRPSTDIQEKTEAITTYRPCPFCGKQVESNYRYCPHCDGMFAELETEGARHPLLSVSLDEENKHVFWKILAAAFGLMTLALAALVTVDMAEETGIFAPLIVLLVGTGFVVLFAVTWVISTRGRRGETTGDIVSRTTFYSLIFVGLGGVGDGRIVVGVHGVFLCHL